MYLCKFGQNPSTSSEDNARKWKSGCRRWRRQDPHRKQKSIDCSEDNAWKPYFEHFKVPLLPWKWAQVLIIACTHLTWRSHRQALIGINARNGEVCSILLSQTTNNTALWVWRSLRWASSCTKLRDDSTELNHFFPSSNQCITASLVKIHPLV